MNGAHVHLVVNHLPIVAGIIAVLVLIAGVLLKKDQIKQTGLGIFIFSAITAVIANVTGEEAEEVVEELNGVSHRLIHVHEEQAELYLVFTVIVGLVALITLFLSIKNHRFTKWGYLLTLALAIGSVILSKGVGTSGGEIRHPEIRKSTLDIPSNQTDEDGEEEED